MPFYFRKSASIGPFRFNFSKSGIGLSFGVKGARIGTGPRGSYIHMGRNGFYYRQTIAGPDGRSPAGGMVSPGYQVGQSLSDSSGRLTGSSVSETINTVNARIRRPAISVRVGIMAIILPVTLAYLVVLWIRDILVLPLDLFFLLTLFIIAVAICAVILGLWAAWEQHRLEKLAKTTILTYRLNRLLAEKYTGLLNASMELARAQRIWSRLSETPIQDWKRNAGAQNVVNLKSIRFWIKPPPFLGLLFDPYCLDLGKTRIYFLPDQLWIYEKKKYSALQYMSLTVESSTTTLVEAGGVPGDAIITGYTWQYVCKDGSPDLRFRNNQKYPVAQYGILKISSTSGQTLILQISDLSIAARFASALSEYIRLFKSGPVSSPKKYSLRRIG